MADADGSLTTELSLMADELERSSASLIAEQRHALAQFEEYAVVSAADLERSCARNVARVVAILRGEDTLPPEVVEDERLSGERRARQGIPSVVVVAAYRAVIGVIRDHYLQTAPELGVSVDAILLGVRRLWILTDHMSSTLVAARHRVELEQARQAEQSRITLLHRALDGSAGPVELREAGASFGFGDAVDYWVVRGQAMPGRAGDLLRQIEQCSTTAGFAPILARHGATVMGILGRAVGEFDSAAGTVAVVGPVRLDGVAAAAEEAASVLKAATLLGRGGVVDREAMSLRMTVVEQASVGHRLHARYVEPIRRGSAMADEMIETVRTYLDCQRSVQVAAGVLSVHVNTLRYRIEKFAELTGSDLSHTDTIVEVWWALQFDHALTER